MLIKRALLAFPICAALLSSAGNGTHLIPSTKFFHDVTLCIPHLLIAATASPDLETYTLSHSTETGCCRQKQSPNANSAPIPKAVIDLIWFLDRAVFGAVIGVASQQHRTFDLLK